MDEYLSEGEQWELVKRWMRENAVWVVGGVVLGVLGLTGWRLWQERVERLAHEASASYEQALEAFSQSDRPRGYALVEELRRDHDRSPYADQGDLLAARVHVDAGEYDKAIECLQRVMDKSRDDGLKAIARGRLARLHIERGNPDQALALLGAGQGGEFAAQFDEIRGDALFAKGDQAGALEAYRAARAGAASGSIDPGLIELKINALEPAAPAAAATPAAPAAAAAAESG